jgi:hypothetical protein
MAPADGDEDRPRLDDSIERVDDLSRRRELRDAGWLLLVPVGVAVVLGLLLAPRRAAPEGIPLPIADARAIAHVELADHQLAERARREPLPGPVRALGSAIRDFHTLEARAADARALGDARRMVDLALIDALHGGNDDLLSLRAVQLEAFLDEARRFMATGEESAELQALAGGFVRSMKSEGWCDGHALTPAVPVLRVMFKQMWNAFLELEGRDGTSSGVDRAAAGTADATSAPPGRGQHLDGTSSGVDRAAAGTADAPSAPPGRGQHLESMAPTLDEQRLLYAFYLSHPHPSRVMRDAIASARRGAHDAKACRALVEAENAATESWRLERIARVAALDPTYPADYARGVASFRRGEYGASAAAFRKWLEAHPEGSLALRAQNYLRAAADADQVE